MTGAEIRSKTVRTRSITVAATAKREGSLLTVVRAELNRDSDSTLLSRVRSACRTQRRSTAGMTLCSRRRGVGPLQGEDEASLLMLWDGDSRPITDEARGIFSLAPGSEPIASLSTLIITSAVASAFILKEGVSSPASERKIKASLPRHPALHLLPRPAVEDQQHGEDRPPDAEGRQGHWAAAPGALPAAAGSAAGF